MERKSFIQLPSIFTQNLPTARGSKSVCKKFISRVFPDFAYIASVVFLKNSFYSRKFDIWHRKYNLKNQFSVQFKAFKIFFPYFQRRDILKLPGRLVVHTRTEIPVQFTDAHEFPRGPSMAMAFL